MSVGVSTTSYRRMMCGCMNRRKILISRRTVLSERRASQLNPNRAHADTASGPADETCATGLRRTFLIHVHSLDLLAVQNLYRNLVSSQRVLRHLDLRVARAAKRTAQGNARVAIITARHSALSRRWDKQPVPCRRSRCPESCPCGSWAGRTGGCSGVRRVSGRGVSHATCKRVARASADGAAACSAMVVAQEAGERAKTTCARIAASRWPRKVRARFTQRRSAARRQASDLEQHDRGVIDQVCHWTLRGLLRTRNWRNATGFGRAQRMTTSSVRPVVQRTEFVQTEIRNRNTTRQKTRSPASVLFAVASAA